MNRLNLFELFAKVSLDTSEYDRGVSDVTKSGQSLGSKLKSGIATAGGIAAKGIGLITGAATAAGGALLALEASTEEYRIAQGKLNTAFEAAGLGADAAQEAYNGFYGILGDTDTATEASQLLAKLANSEEDLTNWTNIAAGVYGTFGDALPIEGLIESANETAKVGEVTGSLADALNWAGINEDEFNAKLAAAGSESERNQLIMETLAGTYDEASDAFYRNNKALVESRKAQAKMDKSLAKLGEAVSNVKTALLGDLLPGLSDVAEGFANMLTGVEGASAQFSTAVSGLIQTGVNRLPEFLNFGVQILSSILTGIVQSIPALVSAIPQVVQSIVASFQQLWPTIQATGVELLTMLANGILEYVPEMMTRLPDAITAILNFLADNFPTILKKGAEFLKEFATGIINAVPDMVSKLPQVITAFVGFVTENLPTIVASGIDILINLAGGIISAIPQLVEQLPQIIDAIVEGLLDGIPSIVNVGKQMVFGLWDGIKSLGSWLGDQVGNFFGGIVGGIKSFLGIHSPSTVFADMGKNMALGLGKGWNNEYGRIKNDIEGGMDFGTASVDFASSGLGVSSAGIINGFAGQPSGGNYSFNLILPGGEKLASYVFTPLADYAKANGTPILNPT